MTYRNVALAAVSALALGFGASSALAANSGAVVQDGNYNNATVTQKDGSAGTSSVTQSGVNIFGTPGVASVTQAGAAHTGDDATISQDGDDNDAAPIVLTTSGGANSVSVSVTQTGSGATVTVN